MSEIYCDDCRWGQPEYAQIIDGSRIPIGKYKVILCSKHATLSEQLGEAEFESQKWQEAAQEYRTQLAAAEAWVKWLTEPCSSCGYPRYTPKAEGGVCLHESSIPTEEQAND